MLVESVDLSLMVFVRKAHRLVAVWKIWVCQIWGLFLGPFRNKTV